MLYICYICVIYMLFGIFKNDWPMLGLLLATSLSVQKSRLSLSSIVFHPLKKSSIGTNVIFHFNGKFNNCNQLLAFAKFLLRNSCKWKSSTKKTLEYIRVIELRHGWTSAQELRHKFRKISLSSAQINFGTRNLFALCRN